VREIHPRQIKRGEDNNFAVLTEQNVRDIRQLAQAYTYKVIAKRYGIHPQTVYRIVKAKRWAHLKDTPAL
jgi:DNA invertase Pin-like site-specific DNA recombinase